ncbi:hypothetical protein V8F20_008939 [Naviculisporaceae sp. PSN 640]
MRPAAVFSALWFLNSFVSANIDTRALEIAFAYEAYRLDVEVSVAEFLADPKNEGKDPDVEKPWKLGRDIPAKNEAADGPNGMGTSPRRYGLNVHAFCAGVSKKEFEYGRIAARARIADPWAPDFRAAYMETKDANGRYVGEPRTIARLPRDNGVPLDPIKPDGSFADEDSKNKYTWGGYNPTTVLGDLNAAKGKTQGNYFQVDNVLGILAKRASELYQKNPTVARPYYERMAVLADEAAKIRKIENQGNQAAAFRKYLEQYEKKNKVKNNLISGNPDLIKTRVRTMDTVAGSWCSGWKYREIDIEATRANWPTTSALKEHGGAIVGSNGAKRKTPDAKQEYTLFSQRWAAGNFADKKPTGGGNIDWKYMPGLGDVHTHLQAQRAEWRLGNAIRAQIADPSKTFDNPQPDSCTWYKLRDPGEGGIRDPVKKRLVAIAEQRA